MNGTELRMEKLAGSLTKSAMYRGTTFELKAEPAAYVQRRINGEVSPEVAQAQLAIEAPTSGSVPVPVPRVLYGALGANL